MSIVDVARVCHEVNRGYCDFLGDHSQVPWDDAPENIKQSAIDGVQAILDGTVQKPSDSHESWMRFKIADGWVYGPTKDQERKEHPCLIPYAELPAEQRAKDYLFFAVVNALREIA